MSKLTTDYFSQRAWIYGYGAFKSQLITSLGTRQTLNIIES